MQPTVHLTEPLADKTTLECESVSISEGLLQADLADEDGIVVIPLSNVAGIEGAEVETEIDTYPMQGGQYTEFVSRIS